MKKRFLVISPHPDDAELAMGGTILRLKSKGHKVFMVDLTSGEPTPYGSKEKRKKETQMSTKVLKVDERVNLGLENRYLFDNKEARLLLAEKIRKYKPDVMFVPYPEDAHPDHSSCTNIAEAARFYAKFTKVALKGKPYYTPRLYYFFCTHLRIIPEISFLIDISKHFKGKFRAIKCYRSQFVVNPKGRFIFDYIEAQNNYYGKLISCKYAEGFFAKEMIKTDDLSDL
ncbi:PIG-L family deacetylase [Candidatus Omnitrophota bacterium]